MREAINRKTSTKITVLRPVDSTFFFLLFQLRPFRFFQIACSDLTSPVPDLLDGPSRLVPLCPTRSAKTLIQFTSAGSNALLSAHHVTPSGIVNFKALSAK